MRKRNQHKQLATNPIPSKQNDHAALSNEIECVSLTVEWVGGLHQVALEVLIEIFANTDVLEHSLQLRCVFKTTGLLKTHRDNRIRIVNIIKSVPVE